MSFDGLFTYCMTHELNELLSGGRIYKIHQPFENEIVMTVRSRGKNHKLLLSAHPTYSRVQITEKIYENPSQPPMFCMVLRKHLEGFYIESITQHENLDRTMIFRIKGRNEIGDLSYKQLIVEIMGRHSNIVLVDEEKGTIIDSIKHVSHAINRYRAILPGQKYIWPPKQEKRNPFTVNQADIVDLIDFQADRIDQQIVNHFAGISPLLAKEIVYRANPGNEQTLPKTMLETIKQIRTFQISPTLIRGDKKDYFYVFPLKHVSGKQKTFSTLSELLDHYYAEKAERDYVKQVAGNLLKLIQNELDKNKKKIKKLQKTLQDAEKSAKYQLYGELLTASLHLVKQGMTEITVMNYYDENGGAITIPLDPQKTPAENAQNYFKKYRKGKNAQVAVQEQLKQTNEEIHYLEGILSQLETASPQDIDEIREELIEEGYMRERHKKNEKRKKSKPELEKYVASDGTVFYVGKNNKQNDYLTMKFAHKEDVWLHTKDIPGSHVVIKSADPSEDTIIEAATVAAYFSKARNSSSVPVDYTKIKHVRKPKGAKPGFVIYDHHQTVYVTPTIEQVNKLKAK